MSAGFGFFATKRTLSHIVRVVRHTDVAAFTRVAVPLLAAAEAENNLLLGLCAALTAAHVPVPSAYLATVEDEDRAVAAAIMTPPRNLVMSAAPRDGLVALSDALIDGAVAVPGVMGRVDVADAFGTLWCERTGDDLVRERDLGVYELTTVIPPAPVRGHLRPANAADVPLVETWAHRFVADTGIADDPAGLAREARRAVETGRLYLWDDGEPVAMAAWTGGTPNGARVTLVYTPPSLRGRGYASSCVAGLSARMLASGKTRCFLFTDLANPTSNHIYTVIGYRRVCDAREWRFVRRH